MAAHFAAPIVSVFGDAWEEFAHSRCFNHCNGAIAHGLRQLCIERHEEVETLASVGVNDTEQGGIENVEKGLIQSDLRRIDPIESSQTITLDRTKALGLDAFVFPQAGIEEPQRLRSGDDDPVGMAAEQSIDGLEFQPVSRREPEPRGDEMLAGHLFKKMPPGENVFDTRRKHRIAHPIELDFTQTLSADGTCAEILSIVLARRLGALDQLVEQNVDRFG
jgi:hypothetical protein